MLKCLLVRAVMDSPYRQTESHVRMAATLLDLTHVPDASTLSLKNRSLRFVHLLRRFHDWMLARLPARRAVIATDATGFGPEKRCWRSTPFPYRAADERWVKMNCAVEVPQLLILNTTIMPSPLRVPCLREDLGRTARQRQAHPKPR